MSFVPLSKQKDVFEKVIFTFCTRMLNNNLIVPTLENYIVCYLISKLSSIHFEHLDSFLFFPKRFFL